MVTESSETFLRVMTGIGGLYLIYLAWDLWRTNPSANVALNAPPTSLSTFDGFYQHVFSNNDEP